ncbi:hypothetical protein [Bosea sp. R86505]|uniref:hypothetical protein n=1 Tax=Bosea sp. R86505 TaxID=3101710 RepID=UPI00366E4944
MSPSDGPTRPVFTTTDAGSADGFIIRPGLIEPPRDWILFKSGGSVAGASA